MATGTIPHTFVRDLLWTNSNPSSLSASTVNINMKPYDFIEIEWTNSGNTNVRRNYTKLPIGTESTAVSGNICASFIDTSLTGAESITTMSRNVDVYALGIVFGSGNMVYNGSLYKDWDNRAVPYRIWGIKY